MKSGLANVGTKHCNSSFFIGCQGYLVILPAIGMGRVTAWYNCSLTPFHYCCQFLLSQINPDSWPDASCANQQDSGLKRASGYKEILQQTVQSTLFSKNTIKNTEENVLNDFTNAWGFLKVR